MKISLMIEGSQSEILAVIERVGCTQSEISIITARLVVDGDASQGLMGRVPLESGERSVCDRISERERQILGFLMEGVSNKEISYQLKMNELTVKSHIKHLLAKIGVTNRTKAALWAQRHMSHSFTTDAAVDTNG